MKPTVIYPIPQKKRSASSYRRSRVVPGKITRNAKDNGITFEGLDPVLGSLGVLVGLLTESTDTPGKYSLVPSWFTDPITNTQNGITNNPEQFQSLLAQVLGKIGGNALGIPVNDPALLGTWYPIRYGEENTGLYLVSYPKDDAGGKKETVLGIGILHAWDVPENNPLLTVDVWALMPFVRIGNGSFHLTFNTPGYPISLGIAVEGSEKGKPLVDINGVSFDGVKFSAFIDIPATDPFSVSLEVLSLKLPGDAAASNRSLADLAAITGEQILETATSLFTGAISKAFPGQDKRIQYIAPLFGLGSTIPDRNDIKMPLLPWYDLFKAASDPVAFPGGVKSLFFTWFNTLSADGNLLQAWISCLAGFISDGALTVSGIGSRTDPYAVSILEITSIGNLDFTVATEVTDTGIRYFYPGLNFTGTGIPLGTSDFVFIIQADLELAKFALSAQAVSVSPDINFNFHFSLNNKTAGQPLIEYDGYSFGSLAGGLALGTGGKIMPSFSLLKVITPQSSFEKVDLLSPSELANTAAAILSSALSTLIGVGQKSFSDNIAALVGLITPGSAGSNWPSELAPPFSPTQMVDSILNPINAWADYYLNTLKYSKPVDGKAAFSYLVMEMALLLQSATDSVAITVDGDGTQASPWKAGISISDQTLPAYLTAYTETFTDNTTELVFGISLAPDITVAGTVITPSLDIEAISILFPAPASGLGVTSKWFPHVGLKLTLPQGFQTPSLGGIVVSTSKSQLSAFWSIAGGWKWSMFINSPELIIDGTPISLGQDLNFNDQDSLENLVKKSAATFSPFLIATLGTVLVRTETRAGLFATGMLGLLADISQAPIFPSGLEWKGFTVLQLTNLGDPWPDVRAKLAQDFSTPETSQSLLSLLSWAIDSSLTQAPAITGNGSFGIPYITPLPKGFSLPVWYEATGQLLGAAIARNDAWAYGTSFSFDVNSRLNLLKYDLVNGKLIFDEQVPSFTMLGTLSSPDGPLINLPDSMGILDKAEIGMQLTLSGGTIRFAPVVNLVNVTLPGQPAKDIITLQDFLAVDFEAALQSAFLALLNAGVQAGIEQVKDKALFKNFYELLSLLGLTLEHKTEQDPYGINTAGWNGLIADYNVYIQSQLLTLLTEPDNRNKLFTFLEQLLHINLPAFPVPALELLAGLGICGPAEEGFPLYPQALLELVSNPLASLQQRFQKLFDIAHPEALLKMAAELAKNIPETKFGNFTFSTNANGVITFGAKATDAFTLGTFLRISGGISLDLNNRVLTAELDPYFISIGVTLQNAVKLQYLDNQFSTLFTVAAVWGDGSKPSATALDLYPFNSSTFLDQLAALAPAYTLNGLLNAILEEELLKKYPLIQKIFTGLGLATATGAGLADKISAGQLKEGDSLWQMSSLMGILKNPMGWLLSDSVLGFNGKFNIAALVHLLSNLPQVSSTNGISINPTANGMIVKGLPYGFEVDMNGDNGVAAFGFTTKDITISEDWGTLSTLGLKITLDDNYQAAFSGDMILSSGSKITVPFFLHTAYDKGFYLSISQGKAATPSGLSVQLLPFEGWGTLAEKAARLAAAALIKELVPQLLQKLSDAGAKDFVDRMKTFGGLVDVASLVEDIIKILSVAETDPLQKIEEAALTWLQGCFSVVKAPNTVDGMIALLSGVLSGLSRENGRLLFQPSADLPVVIKTGLNDQQLLGLWVGLSLPSLDLLKIAISETGVGVKFDGSVEFSFGLDLLLPVDGDNGPAIGLAYVQGTGFVLNFDPLGDQSDFSKQSSLSRQLMPVFFPGAGDLPAKVQTWLFEVFKTVLPRYVAALILNIDSVKTWLEAPIITTTQNAPTPAVILEAVSLIVKNSNDSYSLNTIDALTKLTASSFFGNLLYVLMQHELTLLTFGKEDQCSITIGPKKGTQNYFGLRLMAPDLEIAALPNMVLQLGDNATGADEWIKQTGGPDGDPGVGFYVPINKSDTSELNVDFSFFELLLYNIGFDFKGTNGNPLVDMQRFKIAKISPRVLFELDFNGTSPPNLFFGAAVNLDDIGLSLAPDQLVSGGGANPIASNILGSGTDNTTDNPPSNPTFSVTAAYSKTLWINLQSNTGNGKEVILPVQRSFGPLYVDSLGLGWDDKPRLLGFLFSGNIELAGLKAEVVRLKVGVPTKTPTDYTAYEVDLDGLDISFKGGSVDINGGFLKTETTNPHTGNLEISYTGIAVIKAGTFSLMALGSYAQVAVSDAPDAATAPSLFIFAVLTTPLGGPPAFFITAVAAGFSYNRSIELPSIDKVQDFPLLKGLSDGSFSDGEDPTSGLMALAEVVKPEVGQYWLAAGVKFTSFELITSSVLLFLSFGKDWEVNLLGLSFASLPPGIPKDKALAYFELAIKVSFKPAQGIISAEAQLTPNSFVLSTDCKVTGGFAFYLWYKDITTKDYHISAGDFVITLGGYHPAFQKPVYYPDVPRLGLQWKMEIDVGRISISGGAYFALCPTAVMAGGYIDVTFEMGPLKAWLDAYANFLIEWKPFYFNVGIGITVGVSFGTVIAGVSVTLKAELGAKLNLEGPPTHGSIEVDWYVISFTIPIGSGQTATDDKNLDWKGFSDAFLPAPAAPVLNGIRALELAVQQVVKWKPELGLLNSTDTLWTLQPYPFSLSIQSAIPASTVTVSNSGFEQKGVATGVRPMGYTADLNSPLTLTVTDAKGNIINLAERNISMIVSPNGAPAALWSKQGLNREQAPDSATMLIPGAIFGVLLDASQYIFKGNIVAFDISALEFTKGSPKLLPYKNVAKYPPADRYPDKDQQTAYQVIMKSVMDPVVIGNRNIIFNALEASAIDAPLNPDLTVMASSADNIFQALPVIAHIGIYQNNGETSEGQERPASAVPLTVAKLDEKLMPPKLQGILRRYKVSSNGKASRKDVKSKWLDTEQVRRKGLMAKNIRMLSGQDTKDLYDGSIVVWSVDDRYITTLSLTGDIPVRVSCFDKYGELLVYKYFSEAVDYSMPKGTAQAAIQANEAPVTATAGWQHDSLLARINPLWSLSDSGLIRVQNGQRIRAKGGAISGSGLIDALDLLHNNYVLSRKDVKRRGWIQSVFTSNCRFIGVLVDSVEVSLTSVAVTIAANKIPLNAGFNTAVDAFTREDKTMLVFDCPEIQAGYDYYGVLVVPDNSELPVSAIYGFAEMPVAETGFNAEPLLNLAGQDIHVKSKSGTVSVQPKNVYA